MDLRIFHVKAFAQSYWIVKFTAVHPPAMKALALLVGLEVFIPANVGEKKKKGSVLIVVFGVRIPVRGCLDVGSMSVVGVAILVIVVSVHYRVEGLALAGRERMKKWVVMYLYRYVVELVIRC